MFYIGFFNLKNERFIHSLFFGDRCERIAQVAHQKWVTMSKSLRSLTKNERMSESLIFFLQKTSDSLRKLMSEFPALCEIQEVKIPLHITYSTLF